ncbi:DUF421 domain-containing protein [Streptomyces roseolus]|uniref:DUF421 domain-containing protein n=1 Tax=Streptomyces roseolus TaxID=67358 RepID=UPI00167868ED|nr:YetF domain-containing protein [Streptomyces roseolus]GGR20080.1 DUF421 domain-containing protein [Streptomyces roseolus]
MIYDSWHDLFRVLIMAALAYLTLIAVVRASGKRALSKMNAFDLVITVALGSTLATILLNRQVALLEGAIALTVLVALQFLTAWASVRSDGVRRLVKARPTVLLHQGRMLHEAMRRQRVTPDELRQAVRSQGMGDIHDVQAVVLETDGSFSVISRSKYGSGTALEGVERSQPDAAPKGGGQGDRGKEPT